MEDLSVTQEIGASLLKIRIVYRCSDGSLHFDLPLDQLRKALDDDKGTLWIDIEDLRGQCASEVEKLFKSYFHFHPLAIEDALKDTNVPKVDDWGSYLYMVFNSIDFDPVTDDLCLHELDVFLGKNYLLTYHNEPAPMLDLHRGNIERDPDNRLRHGADHLLFHLAELTVQQYLPAIEHLDDAIDAAQDEVFDKPTTRTLHKIFQVKRSAVRIHRVIVPMREVANRLARDTFAPVQPDHRVYFRDVYDHLVRIHDITEGLRDLITGALDTYLSVTSNRTNDIMKALTMVTVMFLPMSFLAGFFGMNFFGETLMLNDPFPKGTLFWGSCLLMLATPFVIYFGARKMKWL